MALKKKIAEILNTEVLLYNMKQKIIVYKPEWNRINIQYKQVKKFMIVIF